MSNDSKPVRVRMAPSPTGNLHVGTARAALFNYLFARHTGGTFIMRLEDTDKARSRPEFEANILEGLQWLGLSWDEGPDVGGEYGPYRQSERGEIYAEYLQRLLERKAVYFCFCPPQQKEPGERHACGCSELPEAECEAKHEAGEKSVLRLKVEPKEVVFTDIVRGEVSVHTDSFGGDFVVARSMAEPLYHAAVVIDDIEMEISHVIRGEDHLHNTIKHILLQEAWEAERPAYAHLPLLLDDKRRKLSKRRGETDLLAYREAGYLPEAMFNYLALLGWNPGDDRELLDHEELVELFDLERVQKAGAMFSVEKLTSVNKDYMRALKEQELMDAARPFLERAGISLAEETSVLAALQLEQERVGTLAELPEAIGFALPDWQANYPKELLVWRKSTPERTRELLALLKDKLGSLEEDDFTEERLQGTLMPWIDAQELGRGDVLWPMRVALTGQEHSPGPFEVAAVLGKDVVIKRVNSALTLLS